jgi:two-component system, chemotaxis family, protein-glutamate methylesterase/glutaminase
VSEPDTPPPLVVIGGSAGSILPLRRILAELSPTLPATVCVVIHLPDDSASALARVLARAGTMDASFADDGHSLRAGHVVVAPPGNHLLVHDGHLVLSQGARENGTRPAIDPLFRSAARVAGPDVVSILLSGTLDDGSAGTAAVRDAGGFTIVQDPSDADFPDMPRHAIETGQVMAALPAPAIAAAVEAAVEVIVRRREDPTSEARWPYGGAAPDDGTEAALTSLAGDRPGDHPVGDPRGDPVDRGLHGPAPDLEAPASPYGCPSCGGVLYERKPPDQYLCRLGHRYSPESLASAQNVVIEDALWTALRTLEESASLATRVRDRAAARGDRGMELRFEARRMGAQARADRIRSLLEGRLGPNGEPLDGDAEVETEAIAAEKARSA